MLRPLRSRLHHRRTQHLVYLAHIWVCAPFLVLWLVDAGRVRLSGAPESGRLPLVILLTILYLVARTWLAWKDPDWLRWEYHFPPLDVVIITALIFLSHTGPIGNLSILFILPIISASNSLNVRWSAMVGLMVVVGTAFTTLSPPDLAPVPDYPSLSALIRAEPLSAAFRVVFILVLSSLISLQAMATAALKEKLAVEADRNRIALDMHDGVQGHLITLAQQLDLLQRLAPTQPQRAAELAQEARSSSRQAADELRFLVQRLRAPSLAHGFSAALRQYAHNVTSRHRIELEFEVVGQEPTMDAEVENALFRIAQEAICNAVKHAVATHLHVILDFQDHEVQLVVTDDGTGFTAENAAGVGLESMRTRARELGGKTTITSAAGTRVQTTLPLRTS